ncbi:MAG: hypothetical protein JWN21_21 [Sphingomonas bacterium]|uniref:DUF2490 domain-containing protein n=1 Tax=Sphingomonas bacterium TaxID=1895847 RepID=UPI00263093E6|nr:DUF2490 domain-containing protein [Sphingomonas bacterium]MDB5694478.1 hypothetical protein [Sphingomonas bacterium]
MPRRISLALTLLFAATPAIAQQQDEQIWLQVNTVVPLAERWRVTLEQVGRVSDRQGGLYQTEFGGIVGWRVADGVELGFGYRRVGFHNADTGANEHRLRQQVVATFGAVTTRLRIDQRFHPGGGEIGFRVRPLVRYNHRVGSKGVAVFASHESFWLPNSTRWGQRGGYERMRNIAGVALPLGKQVAAEVGYLNQYRFGRDGGRAQMDHALTLQLTINVGGGSAGPRADD